jgi:ATPase subunit of ABC transporter with duplicated ATPase domains
VGKSVLAKIIAGQLPPSGGHCLRAGRVHYLPQQISAPQGATVAAIAGVQLVFDALARIEAGSVEAADFETVGDGWDIRQRFNAELQAHGLGHLQAGQDAAQLSGGELTRVALMGAWLSAADVLVLDEPTNHLDASQRDRVLRKLREWPNGLLVVSHDRQLLGAMQRIIELSASGLRDYGGDYAFYAQTRAQERAAAQHALEQAKLERRRGEADLREQRERQQRREARSEREGKQANQAAILLGGLKQRSQASAGKLQTQQAERADTLDARVREAARQVENESAVALFPPLPASAAQRKVATLENVVLPFGIASGKPLDLTLTGQQRIGVMGANGSGKSSLLKLLAGEITPLSGHCKVHVPFAFLDQQLSSLNPQQSPLQQLQSANPNMAESELRTRLALLGLPGDFAVTPSGLLSGGERLKAALACAIYREQPAELLLLDEPTNHLDLASVEALEQMLLQYRGALVVVSHDHDFLERIALDTYLLASAEGRRIEAW